MTTKAKAAGIAALVITGAALVAFGTYAIAMTTMGANRDVATGVSAGYQKYASVAPAPGDGVAVQAEGSPQYGAVAEGAVTADSAGTPSESLVIRNSQVEVRVDDVDTALVSLRTVVASAGGEIAQMTVSRGGDVLVADGAAANAPTGPAYASVTIRVPAPKLIQLEEHVAELGTVLSQSASADDVTEAAIDLEARLKNLRAEEARLRSFLDRTTDVSELLEVERELARVRGEIESMDAQLTYLERQAALATLTVALSEPGPVAASSGISWALRAALARGIAVAAAMITGLVTIAVPVALIGVIALLVVVPVHIIRKRRTATRQQTTSQSENGGAQA